MVDEQTMVCIFRISKECRPHLFSSKSHEIFNVQEVFVNDQEVNSL